MTSLAAGCGCSIRFSPRRDAPLGMSVSPPSFVQPRQRCTAHQTQQKVEGDIKAARIQFWPSPAFTSARRSDGTLWKPASPVASGAKSCNPAPSQ